MKKTMSLAVLVTAAVPLGLWKASPSSADGAGVQISRNDERPAVSGPETTFTGDVSVKLLFEPNGSRTVSSAEVSFTPCARTAWHTHPAGQTLIVTSGSGWVQEWGGRVRTSLPATSSGPTPESSTGTARRQRRR
ncbi:hypothetical protein MPSYJ_48420 [Mycolicibacterium psychrotolerans]|uniref:Cupin n=1 Tax=Mycolicibacterium psychrotolerans TaxID=216929 RepID=A0A7I7MGB2_9MYCO|nr:hypothetical protein MPSYJ_48420 [Mycolicibacterium psychrotolerans]